MNIVRVLEEFGLSEKVAQIYLTLLQLEEASILDIAEHSFIKRPTVYLGIETLERLGLVYPITHGKKIRYKAQPPSEFKHLLKRREQMLEEILPQLESFRPFVPRGTLHKVQYIEGKEAVTGLYRSALSELAEQDDIYFFSSIRDLHQHFPEIMTDFDRQSLRWKWNIREIVSNTPHASEYIQKGKKGKNAQHQTRMLPKGFDLFDSEFILFKEKIIFIALQPHISAVVISNAGFARSFRSIFQAAWMMAIPL